MLGISFVPLVEVSVSKGRQTRKNAGDGSNTYPYYSMAVERGLGGVKLSQQALLDLERSKTPPVELLEEAAQIVGVDYTHLQSAFIAPDQAPKTAVHTGHTVPKEEWVLRWLLKRTGLWTAGSKVKISNDESLR